MAKMRAVDAAVLVLEKEGIDMALRRSGRGDQSVLLGPEEARHHRPHAGAPRRRRLAHGRRLYARQGRQHRRVHRHVGPGGNRHDHRPVFRSGRFDSDSGITGQAPRARLYKEDFQAVDIESIAKPVTKWAVTVREPALVPRVFQQAFHLMRSGRPGPVLVDLPIDVQLAEIEFDIDTYEPLPVYKPKATREQVEKALDDAQRRGKAVDRVRRRRAQRRAAEDLLVEFAEIARRAGDPDADGLGRDSRRPSADGRHGRLADVAPLRQRDDARLRLRARHRQPLGEPSHGQRRGLYQGPQVRARRHRTDADRPRVRPGSRHRVGCESRARTVRRSGA